MSFTGRAPTSTTSSAESECFFGSNDVSPFSSALPCTRYAWLVPEYTTDPHAAATSFDVSIQRIADLNFADIAKGSHGGKFRYIVPVHDPTERSKVKEVQLLRSAGVVRSPPVGWTGMSRDMNEGRGRSCLYLLWKS